MYYPEFEINGALTIKLSFFFFAPQFILKRIVKCIKVKLSLCLTKHHVMKTYWGVEVQRHAVLTSALDGGE
jgi:hypothetical protein